jgi:WD40 repeat protein
MQRKTLRRVLLILAMSVLLTAPHKSEAVLAQSWPVITAENFKYLKEIKAFGTLPEKEWPTGPYVPYTTITFSPDNEKIGISYPDQTVVRIFDMETGDVIAQLSGHQTYIYDRVFSPTGNLLVTRDNDGIVRAWDLDTKTATILNVDRKAIYSNVVFSSDGLLIAAGGKGPEAWVWETATLHLMQHFIWSSSEVSYVNDVRFNHDGNRLLITAHASFRITGFPNENGRLYVVEPKTGSQLLHFESNDTVTAFWGTFTLKNKLLVISAKMLTEDINKGPVFGSRLAQIWNFDNQSWHSIFTLPISIYH